jgi:hypothetical protein
MPAEKTRYGNLLTDDARALLNVLWVRRQRLARCWRALLVDDKAARFNLQQDTDAEEEFLDGTRNAGNP